ncbi:enoyl-CoA hydratase [Neobacillus notoginsengisoli]|uniref:Enoyl-CoA hydratase n=1 Tax=Neobacillus notoginsengisoli TaxID=1578198 RepID=A0A417Z0X7_9BACI|nr:enoyl-CoA hydratase [Neobacillus notoginsengisoli]RHW43584.1 enoyl-CoA hydratase [Neobacillus notoginsengisoli]
MAFNFVTDNVDVSVNGRVATVKMNRPEALNALNKEMIKGLISSLKEISESDGIDILVLTGTEKAFSAGGDIKAMLVLGDDEQEFYSIMDCINELVITLYNFPAITISAVSGPASGLGFSLALATDYILAREDAKLAMNFIGIGLIPDGGAHFFLAKMIGESMAKQLVWEGKTLNAHEAYTQGLIHEVASDLDTALTEKIHSYLKKPVQAMIKTKLILAELNRPKLLKVLELEKYAQRKMSETKDHREGIKAFVEKRAPKFTGR